MTDQIPQPSIHLIIDPSYDRLTGANSCNFIVVNPDHEKCEHCIVNIGDDHLTFMTRTGIRVAGNVACAMRCGTDKPASGVRTGHAFLRASRPDDFESGVFACGLNPHNVADLLKPVPAWKLVKSAAKAVGHALADFIFPDIKQV